jgi:hypothetical protein
MGINSEFLRPKSFLKTFCQKQWSNLSLKKGTIHLILSLILTLNLTEILTLILTLILSIILPY